MSDMASAYGSCNQSELKGHSRRRPTLRTTQKIRSCTSRTPAVETSLISLNGIMVCALGARWRLFMPQRLHWIDARRLRARIFNHRSAPLALPFWCLARTELDHAGDSARHSRSLSSQGVLCTALETGHWTSLCGRTTGIFADMQLCNPPYIL